MTSCLHDDVRRHAAAASELKGERDVKLAAAATCPRVEEKCHSRKKATATPSLACSSPAVMTVLMGRSWSRVGWAPLNAPSFAKGFTLNEAKLLLAQQRSTSARATPFLSRSRFVLSRACSELWAHAEVFAHF